MTSVPRLAQKPAHALELPRFRGDDVKIRRGRVDLLLAASTGGHLGQALELKSKLPIPSRIVTTDSSRSFVAMDDFWFVPSPEGIRGWMLNAAASLVLTLRLRPSLVVGLGSGGVAFFCLWSRLFGSRLILLESFARVRTASRFFRFVSLIAQEALVQWPEIHASFPGSVLVHPIYELHRPKMAHLRNVFITVGSYRWGMDRLLRIVDEACPLPGNPSMTFQVGNSTYLPRNGAWLRWATPDEFVSLLKSADLVITHDGANTIAQSLQAGKPVIVVPRNSDELDYPSQRELAIELERRGWVLLATNSEDLRHSIDSISDLNPNEFFPSGSLVDRIVSQYSRLVSQQTAATAPGNDLS